MVLVAEGLDTVREHHTSVVVVEAVDIVVEHPDNIPRTVWEEYMSPSPSLDLEPQSSSHNSMERYPDDHLFLLSTNLR